MTLKFLYITQDPFINNSEEFVRILAISDFAFAPQPNNASSSGVLLDSNGIFVANANTIVSYENTEATAYPFAYASEQPFVQMIIIPPGWSFRNFGRAIAIQGSLEEVLRVH